jgi:hypothetical protein
VPGGSSASHFRAEKIPMFNWVIALSASACLSPAP